MAEGKAVTWARVSGDRQETENQVLQLQGLAKSRVLEIVEVSILLYESLQ